MLKKRIFEDIDEIAGNDDAAIVLLKRRLMAAVAIILLFFGIIVARLWYLQISHGDEYRQRAYNNRVRSREIDAPRGNIIDRYGREIVTNRPSFNVVLIRENSYDIDDLLKRLAKVLNVDISTLWSRIREAQGTPRYVPVLLQSDIDWNALSYLENHNQDFSGIRIEVQPVRKYHYKNLASQVLGYLGVINKDELQKANREIYSGGDLVGRSGLEKIREADLRGEKGSSLSEVNARGFEQQLLKEVAPLPGCEITLTIDAELQNVAESFMEIGEKAGAVVAMEVNTGRLLTVASSPPIHLEEFVGGISKENWQAHTTNSKKPLLNKAIQAVYPPGSTYKMITAFAGLATGVITPDTKFYCPGHYRFGNRTYHCWRRAGHGEIDLKTAIARSCDVYFYQVGQKVGVDRLAKYAKMFGLGQKTGVELEDEKSGVVPTKEWNRKKNKRKWQEGETLSVAIGQGANSMTPLQICLMTSVIANGGKHYLPQIIEKVTGPDENIVEKFEPKLVEEMPGYEQYFALIRDAMKEVVHGKRGTARNVRIENLTIGGKTGTAQVVKVAKYKHLKEKDIPYKYRDHAWFTCFAPVEKPEIAVTVMVEHGLHGSTGAGPVAKAVLEKYFEKRLAAIAEEKIEKQ